MQFITRLIPTRLITILATVGSILVLQGGAQGAELRATMYGYQGGAANYMMVKGQHVMCDDCPATPPLQVAPKPLLISIPLVSRPERIFVA